MVLAIPVAWLVRTGLAEGFSEYELPALGCVALLLLSFPWVGAPVGLGATLIVAMLIVRRAGGEGDPISIYRSHSYRFAVVRKNPAPQTQVVR
jgi:hypothetical protein